MQALQQSGWQELSPRLCCYEMTTDGGPRVVDGEQKRRLLRALFQASPRIKAPADQKLVSALTALELSLFQELRRPSDEQIVAGIRNAVTPLFAGVISD